MITFTHTPNQTVGVGTGERPVLTSRAPGVQICTRHCLVSQPRHIKLPYRGNVSLLFVSPTTGLSIDMNDNTTLYAASLCVAASLTLALRWKRNRSLPPYPPGPRGYPLIGSVSEVPRDVPMWKGFLSLAEKFSRCRTSAGGYHTEDVTVPRHGCTAPQTVLTGLHRFEQQ